MCYCQASSRLLTSSHFIKKGVGTESYSENVVKCGMKTCDYAELLEIPSLRILTWRVDRFIPRRAAAPLGPAMTQLLCISALMIC